MIQCNQIRKGADKMTATLYNPTTKKQVVGTVLQRGLNKITLVVIGKSGSTSIKSFNETKWIVNL